MARTGTAGETTRVLTIGSDRHAAAVSSALAGRAGVRAGAGGRAFRTESAADVDTAIERMGASRFDALVMELDDEGPDAGALIQRVRATAQNTVLVVVTPDDARPPPADADVDATVSRSEAAALMPRVLDGALACARLRAELSASEARFRNIIERTADGIVIVGEDHRVLFVNHAAEQVFGRSAASLLGQDFGFAVVNGHAAELDIVRQGEPAIGELRVSATRWEGRPAQLVSVRDITDRKRAEDRAHRLVLEQSAREQAERAGRRASFLAEAGKRLDASLDPQLTLVSLSQLIVPRMADWCVVDIVEGDAVRRIAGIHSDPEKQPLLEELHRRYPPVAGSPEPARTVIESGIAELHRELNEERLARITIDAEHAGLLRQLGTRSSITVPLRARKQLLGAITIVCNVRNLDASDLELLEEVASRAGQALENARLYEAAVSASKARSDFLAVVSHELRTPLNAILGYTRLLLEGVTGDPDARLRQLRRIDASASDLLQIIQKILAFASMEAARLEPDPQDVRLGELMDGVAAVAGPLARDHGLVFGLHVRDPDAQLFTDAGKLRQITLDLLTNAVKFTANGRIDLAGEVREGDLVIDVRDTGVGITSEHMAQIFEPFWQAEATLTRQAGGMGLGLTVSRRLAMLLGGDITATSEPGAGSTFTLRVPARITAGAERDT